MNTGKEIETSRLWLRPGKNERDSSPFLLMLRNDGDFQQYCGARFSEENLSRFANYFERVNDEMCMYSLFLKTDAETFIGYVGFHREGDGTFAKWHASADYQEKVDKANGEGGMERVLQMLKEEYGFEVTAFEIKQYAFRKMGYL